MNGNYSEMPGSCLVTIQKGIAGVRRFSSAPSRGTGTRRENTDRLKKEFETADAIVIGAEANTPVSAEVSTAGIKKPLRSSRFHASAPSSSGMSQRRCA